MTLSQELRQPIIQQVLSGKQYRDISKQMGISIGSIANIAKKITTTTAITKENGYPVENSQKPL